MKKIEKFLELLFETEEERQMDDFSRGGKTFCFIVFLFPLAGIIISLLEGFKYGWEPVEVNSNGLITTINPVMGIKVFASMALVVIIIFFLQYYDHYKKKK